MQVRPVRGVYAGTYAGSGHHPLHRHSFWEMIYQRTGLVDTRQGPTVVHMHPGMVLIHPPHVEHEDNSSSEYSIFYVQMDASPDMPWPRVLTDDTEQSIGRLCEALAREWKYRLLEREKMISLLTQQLDLLLRRAKVVQHRSPEEDLVASAQRLMEERFHKPLNTSELARELGVSRSALYTLFSSVTGQTPKSYILQFRLERALAMLRTTDYTLEAVAACTGFYSASHLTRHVKAVTNKTPGSFRKSAQHDLDDLPPGWLAYTA